VAKMQYTLVVIGLSIKNPAPVNPTFVQDAAVSLDTVGDWSTFFDNTNPSSPINGCSLMQTGCLAAYGGSKLTV